MELSLKPLLVCTLGALGIKCVSQCGGLVAGQAYFDRAPIHASSNLRLGQRNPSQNGKLQRACIEAVAVWSSLAVRKCGNVWQCKGSVAVWSSLAVRECGNVWQCKGSGSVE